MGTEQNYADADAGDARDTRDAGDPGDAGPERLTRSLDLMWGVHRKNGPARGPKPALTLDGIVEVAIRLANRDGVAALSMRALAAELGVGTMSLYRYVPGKGELIDLMVDHASGPGGAHPSDLAPSEPSEKSEASETSETSETSEGSQPSEPSGGADWRRTLEEIAEGSWRLYTTNPWLLQINRARPVLGPRSLAGFESALTALADLGLSGQERVGILVSLDNLVLGAARGYVLQQEAVRESGFSDEAFWRTQEPYLVRALEGGDYPHISSLPEDSFAQEAVAIMRLGLAALLDGFAGVIAARSRELSPPRELP